ncbi:MAG: ATP-binding protein, partial [Gammaproteobacteria bacterium]
MSASVRILLIDESPADIALAARLIGAEFPTATLVTVIDTSALATALSAARVDALVLAPQLGWADSGKIQELARERWPRAAVVLFGHERDIVATCLSPARACAGLVRKSSGGFLALGELLRGALAAAAAPPPALELMPMPAARIDADGRIGAANAALEAALGCMPGELAGTVLADHCDDAAACHSFIAGRAGTGAVALRDRAGAGAGQLQLRRGADGSLFGCLVAPVRGTDNDAGASREMQDIALVFSHDLRQPMQQITRLARQLSDDSDQPGQRTDARTLEQLRACAERAGNMLDGMLEYLALSTRDAQADIVDLNDCLAEALDNLRPTIDENEAQVYAERLPNVRGDAIQLVHLLQNLIGNALKFRGRARPEIRVLCHETEGHWRIEVHDNGIGIPAPHRERVFEMGQRLHTREEYPGTGIGLALCRRIIERHGGTIRIEGGAEAGSVVVIDLPRTRDHSMR